MRHNVPSIKTLLPLVSGDRDKAKLLRSVLDDSLLSGKRYHDTWTDKLIALFPSTYHWLCSCYNPPSYHEVKMSVADEIIGTFGVEYIPRGSKANSPAIEYCNAGDTYATTLLYVNGRYRVGCWGDIVERGNYA